MRGERRKEEEGLPVPPCPSHTSSLVLKLVHPLPQAQLTPPLLFPAPLPRFQPSCPSSTVPVLIQKEGFVNNARYNDKMSVLATPVLILTLLLPFGIFTPLFLFFSSWMFLECSLVFHLSSFCLLICYIYFCTLPYHVSFLLMPLWVLTSFQLQSKYFWVPFKTFFLPVSALSPSLLY